MERLGTNSIHFFQGELAHRQLKKFYQNTNKQNPLGQIAKQERRLTRARREIDPDRIYFQDAEPEENEPANLSKHYY